MVTHSSILAWKIPWTEEPGGLQPMGLLRVRDDSVCVHTHTYDQNQNFIEWALCLADKTTDVLSSLPGERGEKEKGRDREGKQRKGQERGETNDLVFWQHLLLGSR